MGKEVLVHVAVIVLALVHVGVVTIVHIDAIKQLIISKARVAHVG